MNAVYTSYTVIFRLGFELFILYTLIFGNIVVTLIPNGDGGDSKWTLDAGET